MTSAAEQQFAALRERFRAGLAQRGAEIRAAQAGAAMPELAAALHRLAGAAGPYGFAEIGVIARRAEALVMQQARAGAAALPNDANAALTAAVAELLQALSAA